MSKQHFLKPLSIITLGILTGYGVTSIFQSSLNQEMTLSSLAEPSRKTLSKLGSENIYQDYFDIRIQHETIAEHKDQASTVKALIKARKNIPQGIHFKWILGENVSAAEDQLKGTLGNLSAGEEKEISLSVYGFNKLEISYLSFEVHGFINDNELKKEILTSSRPEDSFEYLVQRAHQKESSELKKKGLSKMSASKKGRFDQFNIIK